MSPNNRHNTGTIACVVDTECSYITKNPRMIFHFGATFGDLEQEHSFNVIKMDFMKLINLNANRVITVVKVVMVLDLM